MYNLKQLISGTLLAATALTILTLAPAQAEITLKSFDGTFEVDGEFLGLDDENYSIRTNVGELLVRREFVQCIGDECPKEKSDTVVAQSNEINLKSFDGTTDLVGELLEFDGTNYVIVTQVGTLTVRSEFVQCIGDACPTVESTIDTFSVAAPADIGQKLMSIVVSDFSAGKDLIVTQSIAPDGNSTNFLVGDDKGQELANVDVMATRNHEALKSVIDGTSSFALVRGKATPELVSELAGRNIVDINDLLVERTVGIDALSVVSHPNKKLNVLSVSDLRNILVGNLTNWAQVGGNDAPINLHLFEQDSDLMRNIRSKLVAGSGYSFSTNANYYSSFKELDSAIAADENAFSIVYRSQLRNAKAMELTNTCQMFYSDSTFSIQTEEYPFATRWYQYALRSAKQSDFSRNLSGFLQTDQGQFSIASVGLVDQALRLEAMKTQGERILSSILSEPNNRAMDRVLRTYLSEAANSERASTSLRFLSGSTELDVRGLSDISRISDLIRTAEQAGDQILLFGFSDSFGDLASNLSLSKSRAESVKNLLLADNPGVLDFDDVVTFGMGPTAPVDCNDTAEGRQLNRRVEVWLRQRG